MLENLLDGVRSFFLGRSSSDPEEKRRLVRVRCHIPVQVKCHDKLVSALVCDMGIQGMRVRIGSAVKTGTRLPVLHNESRAGRTHTQIVNCRVAWCRRLKGERRYSAGLIYDEPKEAMRSSWVAALLRELGLDENTIHEQRKFIRANGIVPIWLRPQPGQTDQPKAEMVNLGVGGALLRSRQIMKGGQRFLVDIGPHASLPPLKKIEVEVLHCHSDPAGGGYLVALRFHQTGAEQVRLLGRYVLALMKS